MIGSRKESKTENNKNRWGYFVFMGLKIHNTMSGAVEEFVPLNGLDVGFYTCGPTVYNYAHIGNLRSFIFADILKKYLRYRGYAVKHVMNITDVDDKTIRDSQKEHKSLKEFTEFYTKEFFNDFETLRIDKPDIIPRATETIPEMISLIKKLGENGHTYLKDGSTYYKISTFDDYGKLSKIDLENVKDDASGRLSDEYEKDDPRDFALWKAWSEDDGHVFWETAIGKGRPGWHIECSAMSMKYLGESFDIHTGGVDLIFPHHENEIAQSEGATGKQFVKYWIHCEHLMVEGKKMAKSIGNFYTLRDILAKGYGPMSVRYVLLATQYKQKLNFTFAGLDAAKNSLNRLKDFVANIRHSKGIDSPDVADLVSVVKNRFVAAMDEDLNVSEALAAIFDFVKEINKLVAADNIGQENVKQILSVLEEFDSVLSILDFKEASVDSEIESMIAQREAARKNKNFAASDKIRDSLKAKGILLDDTRDGVRWKKI
jgi:cysteinyl-tRNA synthetase